jgi:hypothetical protein
VGRQAIMTVLGGILLMTISRSVHARLTHEESPLARMGISVGDAARGQQGTAGPDDSAEELDEDDAAAEQVARLLLGDDGLGTSDPEALNLVDGQPVKLSDRDTGIQVTPGKVSAGTDDCAPGPLITVHLSVKLLSGYAPLELGDFSMRNADGTTVSALLQCSTGFNEEAEQRTLVFGAAQPGRLVYGSDVAAPEAIWRLS